MYDTASNVRINSFLNLVRQLVSDGKMVFIPRKKNLNSLAEAGLLPEDVEDEIMELTTGNYYKGPKQDFDRNRPGEIWEFKKLIDGKQFYIKLKIDKTNNESVLKCLSFHKDEF